ncbi:hypothetical protein MMC30_004133 [Trapelia coarctata]|nr:hypothetical protein [Trapelia coarctata]
MPIFPKGLFKAALKLMPILPIIYISKPTININIHPPPKLPKASEKAAGAPPSGGQGAGVKKEGGGSASGADGQPSAKKTWRGWVFAPKDAGERGEGR